MNNDLDKMLCSRYPKMFTERGGYHNDTDLGWGIACDDGWFDLIDTLCDSIQSYIDNKSKYTPDVSQVEITQIKEKFGTLRFYANGGDDVTDGMIWFAESMSGKICEVCGTPGKRRSGGWIRTLCDEHAKPREE